MYLLTQTREKKGKVYKYYSVARSYREGKKVHIEILHRVGKLSDEAASQMKAILKLQSGKGPSVTSLQEIVFSDHWQYLDVATLDHIWERWGLSSVFDASSRDGGVSSCDIAKILVFNRCLSPGSKAYAARWVRKTALDHILDIDCSKVNDDKIYHELPKLEARKNQLESHIFKSIRRDSPESLDIVFYDLTTSHFEGSRCPLGRPGRTKNCGFKSHKINLSLIVTQDGLPFSWEVLPGDTAEVSTIEEKVVACKVRFGIERINLVFDRGMVSEDNLKRIEQAGYHYTSALDKNQIPSIPGLDLDLFKEEDSAKIIGVLTEASFQKYDHDLYFREFVADKRYVVGFNPALFEEERKARRERIERLLAFVREKNEALAKARKSINEKTLSRTVYTRMKGLGRLYDFVLESKTLKRAKDASGSSSKTIHSFEIKVIPKTEKLEQAKLLDGLCAFITNNKEQEAGLYLYAAERVIGSYRAKDKIEKAFCNIKSFIEFNPIYVFKEAHVRAHYTLCVLAYLLNIVITNQVREATSLRSSLAIYEELSRGIIGHFRTPADPEGVKKLKNPTPLQKNILSALGCEYLINPKHIERLLASRGSFYRTASTT